MTALVLAARLGMRNVLRYARRSLITAFTIAGSFAMLVLTIGISEGSYVSVVDSAARSGSGHVVVRAPGHDIIEPVGLVDVESVLARAREIAPGAVIVPRAEALIVASASSGSATLLALGVEPAIERHASLLPAALVEGEWLPDERGRVGKVLMGRTLAKRLRIDVGDKLVVTARGPDSAVLLRVGGLFATGSPAVDDGLLLMDRAVVEELLGEPGAVHQVAIVLDDMYAANATRDALALALPGANVMTWAEAVPELGDYVALDRTSASGMFFVLFALVGLAILNSILMSVFERTRELGVLLALGTTPGTIFAMVIFEGLCLSVVSVTMGLGMGWAGVAWLGAEGFDLSAMMGGHTIDTAGFAFEPIIYPLMNTDRTIDGVVMVIGLTVIAALYPAWKAANVPPVEAISRQ